MEVSENCYLLVELSAIPDFTSSFDKTQFHYQIDLLNPELQIGSESRYLSDFTLFFTSRNGNSYILFRCRFFRFFI